MPKVRDEYRQHKPLTRADVERLLREAGSPDKLNLSGQNLEGVTLVGLDLSDVNLARANLRKADLHDAELSGANLARANLYNADLRGVNLGAANLFGTNLRAANLSGADLSEARLFGAKLLGTIGFPTEAGYINDGTTQIMKSKKPEDSASVLLISILEEPLTAQNFTTIILALTELHTKAWLIQQGRFSDLINYAQTHDIRFTKEANLTIGKLAHNSPALVELILNPTTLTAAAGAVVTLAGALKIAIDSILQISRWFKEKELDLEGKKLEMEKAWLDVEENALKTASEIVDMLYPGIDKKTKGMLVQALLPSLLRPSATERINFPNLTIGVQTKESLDTSQTFQNSILARLPTNAI